MRELARIRDFRLLFAGLLASIVGDLLLTLMLAVWVARLTGSDGAAGITLGCEVIAYAISPLIASPVDRFRRRPLVIAANVATAAILVPLLTVHLHGRIWVIYAVAVAYGVSSVIASAASQGLIGLIVPAAATPDAYGALQTAQQSLRVVVPVLGIAIYTRMGPTVVVVMTVASLLISAVAIAAIRTPEKKPEPTERRWITGMTAGARHLASDRVLSRITVGNSSAMLAAGAFAVLGFAVVTDGLGKPAGFLSVLISVQAGTAIVAATMSARIVKRLGEIAATSVAFALAGIGMFLTVFPSLAVVITAYAVAGFAVPLGGVSAYSAAQRRIPAPVFARTMVTFTSAVALPQAIGIPAAAAVLGIVGFRPLILTCFAIVMLASAYMWRGRALTRPSGEATQAETLAADTPAAETPSTQLSAGARQEDQPHVTVGTGRVGAV
jgi:MFS family permease